MKCCSVDVDMLAAALIHVKTWTKVSAEIVLVHNLQKCKQSSLPIHSTSNTKKQMMKAKKEPSSMQTLPAMALISIEMVI